MSEVITGFCQAIEAAPDKTVETDDEQAHHTDSKGDAGPLRPRRCLGDVGPQAAPVRVVPPQLTTSETMLAFQAPPLAVTPPVTQAEKIPGMINFCQRYIPVKPTSSAISRRSEGMLWAPAMALKRMYHWVPNAMRRIEPQPIGI